MPLFRKCSSCNTKGFFLKISNGLCESCSDKLIELECTYTSILKSLSTDSENKKQHITSLISIINDINQFKNFSSVLDYNFALNIINENIMGLESNSNDTADKNNAPQLETLTLPTLSLSNKPKLKLELNTLKSDVKNEISTNTSKILNTDNLIVENKVVSKENDNIPALTISNNNISTNTTLSIENNLESSVETSNLSSDDVVDMLSSEITTSPNPSEKILIDELYKNVSDLIKFCNTNPSSLNELGKTFFLMKDNYLPMLNKYNIDEVNGTNVDDFISALENKLTLLTSQPKEELYNFFNYVAISIQTSGNNKSFDYILEISASKISFGEIIDEFYTLINPVKTINTNVIKKTGIDNSMILNSPTIDIALLNLKDFIDDYQLVSYNSTHTIGFLALKYKTILNFTLPNTEVCILRLYRIRYRDYHSIAPKVFDMFNICTDLLSSSEVEELDSINSIAESSTLAIYKLYETLKYKYK